MRFVTFVGVDREHLAELEIVWPAWEQVPALMDNPIVFLVSEGVRFDFIRGHKNHMCLQVEEIEDRGMLPRIEDQRFRMLNALTIVPSFHPYQAEYYCKLDTDAVPDSRDWPRSVWFERTPAMVAPRWGYTKPGSLLKEMDDWSIQRSLFCHRPRPAYRLNGSRAMSDRIISYCSFVNWRWANSIVAQVDRKIPIPSQDTFLWYCAARLDSLIHRVKMWRHCSGKARLQQAVKEFLCSTSR